MKTLPLMIVSLFGTTLLAQQGEASHPNPPATKSAFLVIYKPGPAWLPGKRMAEQPLREHGKYMLSLYSQGDLKIAGPFSDETGGALVLNVASDAEAKNIVANDPAVVTGVFVYELHPWGLVDWASMKK